MTVLTVNVVYSQDLSGKITDLNNKPLSYSDIIVKDSLSKMIAYSITNAVGEYSMNFEKGARIVWVQANFMGFDKLVKKIDLTKIKKLDFALKERTEEIKTIYISAKAPVQIEKNNTVVFNLSRLTNGTEEVVEDILKKLPGVEVDGSGRLKYKGKEVTKMLLDGDDLFQANYTLGSKNMRASHIAGVEAIKNYSDNPLLRGIENSDEVAINLKFKSGLSLSNTASIAYGSSEKYSVDYKNIAVTKKLKTFSYLKFDNLGLQQSMSGYNPAMSLSYDSNSEFGNPGYLETGTKSSLFQSRQSNFNDALSSSINIFPKFSETFKVRLNLDFIKDYSENSIGSKTIIQAENPIVIEEKKTSKFKPQYLKGDLNITKYLSENLSFENISKFSFFKNTNEYSGVTNGINQFYKSNSNADFLYNESNLTKRLNENNGLKFNAVFSKSETPEDLYVNPAVNLVTNTNTAINEETIDNEKYQIQFKADYYHKTKNRNKFNFGVKYNYLNRDLHSQLSDGNLNIINDIQFEKSVYELSSSYTWKRKKLEITPQVIYNYIDYRHSDKNGKQSLYNGAIRFQFKPSKRHNFNLNIDSKQLGIDDNKVFTNYILSSNRSLKRYQLDYGTIKSQSIGFRYNYLNTIKFNQLTFSLQAGNSNKAYINRYDINRDVSYTNIYLGDNESKSLNVFLLYSMAVNWIYGNVNIVGKYNYLEYVSELNNVLSNNYVHSQTANLRWESFVIGSFVLTNGISYTKTDYGSFGNESMSNQFEVLFYRKNFRIATGLNYLIPSLDRDYDELSLNTKVQYKIGKFLLSCEGINLLNEEGVNNINQTDFMSMQNFSLKQSRYFLLGLSFKF